MRPVLLLPVLLFTAISLPATNLTIDAVEWYYTSHPVKKSSVKFTIRWDNAWRNDRNYDAAWVVVKLLHETRSSLHARPDRSGHMTLTNHHNDHSDLHIAVPEDQTGSFLFPGQAHRGSIAWTVHLELDTAQFGDNFNHWEYQIALFGIEMVYIPAAGFTLGDPDTTQLRDAALYQSAGNGEYGGLYKVNSESAAIEIGPEKGKLFYQARTPAYQGDQSGVLHEAFPKGVGAFYTMKYELKQGQYADFLQTLTDYQSQNRANFGGKNYYRYRGTIDFDGDRYFAAAPDRPCNFLSWDDAMSYADWVGLRPMTELEFTKACRGDRPPAHGERPWGSPGKEQLARYVNEGGDLVLAAGLSESQLTDGNRDIFGASYFWVMDLAGSLWERVITIGHEKGRAYQGTHGDGRICYYGFATNEDWPEGVDERGGFGFRGGGFYFHGKPADDLNPHSPVAKRRFAAWSGGNRTEAYGSRFVRTAE